MTSAPATGIPPSGISVWSFIVSVFLAPSLLTSNLDMHSHSMKTVFGSLQEVMVFPKTPQ